MNRIISLIVIILCFSTVGYNCAGIEFIDESEHNHVFENSFDKVFDAAFEVVQSRGYFIRRIDRENGILETGYKPGSVGYTSWTSSESRSKIGLNIVRLDKKKIRVSVQLERQYWSSINQGWKFVGETRESLKDYYPEFFKAIDAALVVGSRKK